MPVPDGYDGAYAQLLCRVVDKEKKVLFLLSRNKGEWLLPSGVILPDENYDMAARRILDEQTGLRPERVEHIGVVFYRPYFLPAGYEGGKSFQRLCVACFGCQPDVALAQGYMANVWVPPQAAIKALHITMTDRDLVETAIGIK